MEDFARKDEAMIIMYEHARFALIEQDLRIAKARLEGLSLPDLEKIIDEAIKFIVDNYTKNV